MKVHYRKQIVKLCTLLDTVRFWNLSVELRLKGFVKYCCKNVKKTPRYSNLIFIWRHQNARRQLLMLIGTVLLLLFRSTRSHAVG